MKKVLGRKHGRLYAPDKRDKKFKFLARKSPDVTSKTWRYNWVGDQDVYPVCVGFGWAGWLYSAPIKQWVNPFGIYELAQHLDEWDGEDYDGTSVRAGAKVLKALGAIKEYRWTWDAQEVANHILTIGPVVVGTAWFTGMNNPRDDNYITPSGRLLGGHCYLLYGYTSRGNKFKMKNSYGTLWGYNGTALLSFEDFQTLLNMDGEACVGIEQEFSPENA